jgi:DNA mismatch endonuclease (patch repair protein)
MVSPNFTSINQGSDLGRGKGFSSDQCSVSDDLPGLDNAGTILMADILSVEARSELMRRIRGKDTGPELIVRRLVHGMGYRYRLHGEALPGKPDLVFASRRKVVFVHGCFWHWHADPVCRLSGLPKSRLDFWHPKLDANRARDAMKQGLLRQMDWEVLVIWECETRKRNHPDLCHKIKSFLDREQSS